MESVVADKENRPLSATKPVKTLSKHSKHKSQSGSLAYGKISDKDHNGVHKIDDWKKMQNICVIARFRPKNKREIRWSKANNVPDKPPLFQSKQTVSLEPSPLSSGSRISLDLSSINNSSSSNVRHHTSTLDAVLDPHCTQKQVFYRCGVPMIGACLDGYNATIFAYGQSGSGKTYTMMGPESDIKHTDDFGLIPRCIIYLFQKLDESLSQNGGKLQDYMVNMESLQIYKSQVLDLLNPNSKKKLVIKTNFSTDTVFVQNLKSVQIQTVQEAFKLLTKTQQNRVVKGHSLNEVSSRSHMLISMKVVQRSLDGTLKTSKLNFGDLAGSEDLTKALGRNPNAERRKEAIAINRSLSALTTAVSYLSRGSKPSFRDSPLTHILKDSLGGNSKTIMLVAASPHIYNRGETIRTLRFASTAKKVKNKAKVNEQKSMSGLKRKIKELERENGKLRRRLKHHDADRDADSCSKKGGKLGGKSKSRNGVSDPTVPSAGGTKKSKKDSMLSDFTVDIKEMDEEEEDRGSVLIHDDEEDEKMKEAVVTVAGTKRRGSMELALDDFTSAEIVEIGDEDDEWGSDTAGDTMMVDFTADLNAERGSVHAEEEEEEDGHLELHEYVEQLHEYRARLDRETDENMELQFKVEAKNVELERFGNRISELMEELNQNEVHFHDSKTKIAHLQHLLAQYQTAYPMFKPDASAPTTVSAHTSSGSYPSPLTTFNRKSTPSAASRSSCDLTGNGMLSALGTLHDDYDAAAVRDEAPHPFLQHRLSLVSQQSHRLSLSAAGSRSQSVVIPTHLLENLLTLQQRMESKMKDTETALNEIKQSQQALVQSAPPLSRGQSHGVMADDLESTLSGSVASRGGDDGMDGESVGGSSALIYESADEKLSEWDLDVSVMGSHSDASKASEGALGTVTVPQRNGSWKVSKSSKRTSTTSKASKELRQHLRTLSRSEKRLKRDLDRKLKEEATTKSTSGWCRCFWAGAPTEEGSVSGQLMEQYLRMQVRRELVKDRYQRKKERNRAKILKKRMRKKRTISTT